MQFGVFELDTATGTLSRAGTPVHLQPQPARVLTMLLERAGEVVTRDELRQHVWQGGTVVDFERGLNFCIAQIRSALGDSAESPRFIETLPRRGYRFVAPVRRLATDAAAPETPSPTETAHTVPAAARSSGRAARLRWAIAFAVMALLLAASAAVFVRARSVPGPARIAVVPFDNETGSAVFDDVAGGVADATVARLATPERLQRFSVIGNAAVLRRPRQFRDLEAIGRELDADYIVLAQVKRDQTRARLIAHLIRVSDQAHLWANTFDRPAFTLDVQAEIAEAIASAVTGRLGS
jgi:DNA-binding winged helix-turn-helix (wHTH) protein/TolB-like protein